MSRLKQVVIAEELSRVYPEVERTLGDLVARIHASDVKLEVINRQLPARTERLPGAEEMARGLRGFMDGGAYIPRITEMSLPAFAYTHGRAYAWAPARGTRPAGPGPA